MNIRMLALFTALCCASVNPKIFAAGSVDKGFFRAEKQDGRWWLISPDGERFISKGVCHIQFAADPIQETERSLYGEATLKKYGGKEAWRQAGVSRLLDWGFNSIGAWSDEKLVEIEVSGHWLADSPIVDFGSGFVSESTRGQAWLHGVFPDVFDPKFKGFCEQLARKKCAPRKNDRRLLGWFTDNELRWGADWRGRDELLTLFLNLTNTAPGRQAALALLRQRHGEVERLNRVWKTSFASWQDFDKAGPIQAPFTRKAVYAQNEGEEHQANQADPLRASFVADSEAFLEQLAESYFRITREALRAADPNHLNFGCRFAYLPPTAVRAAAARYLDVISFNCYATDPEPIVRQYAVLDRPLVIGEFTFRAADVDLPNTRGAGPKVATQADRAAGFERYVQTIMHQPQVVGYHWFQHSDQPKEGRFDGENSNYGVVNSQDEPYRELTSTMTRVNALAVPWHAGKAE